MDLGLRQAERQFRELPSLNSLLNLWKIQQRSGVPVELGLATKVSWPVGHQYTFREEINSFAIEGLVLNTRILDKILVSVSVFSSVQRFEGFCSVCDSELDPPIETQHARYCLQSFKLKRWFWEPKTSELKPHNFILYYLSQQDFLSVTVPFYVSLEEGVSYLILPFGGLQDKRLPELPEISWETLSSDQLGIRGPNSNLLEVSGPETSFELPSLLLE